MANNEQKVLKMLEKRFVCPACKGRKPKITKVAVTPEGWQRVLDYQSKKYYFISCRKCGNTKIIDCDVFGKKKSIYDILDFLNPF